MFVTRGVRPRFLLQVLPRPRVRRSYYAYCGLIATGAVFWDANQSSKTFVLADSRTEPMGARADFMLEKDYDTFEKEYEFVEVIGKGGFAEIWKVKHKLTGLVRAAKIVTLDTHNDYRLFRNEVDVLKRLDSPYNVRIVNSYISTNRSGFRNPSGSRRGAIVYHFIKGDDLLDTINQRIATKNKYTDEEIALITKHILKAICYVHHCGILHRDIKPENFIVERDDSPERFNLRLIDFGLSHSLTSGSGTGDRASGTWFYSAPETISNSYSAKSDLWSAGIILTMLASQGTALIGRSTSMGIAGVKRIRDPVFISTEIDKLVKIGISHELVHLLKRMLDPSIESRITPLDALNDPVLSPPTAEPSSVDRWRRSKSVFESLPLFARHVRRLYVHEMNDSDFPRLRFLFRIIDKEARGTVTIADDGTDYQFGYREFLAAGLEDGDIQGRLESFFKFLSNGGDLITDEILLEKFPGLDTNAIRHMIGSCRPGDSRETSNSMSFDDFQRCMLTPLT